MKAIVIGGGIGGLTAGTALSRKGWDVTVLERTPKLEPVGSGLAIAVNGLRALDTIGLGDPVRALARIQGQVGIRRPDGRWLTHTSGGEADERYGDRAAVMLLRSHLVDLLAGALGPDRLRLGTTVTGVDAATGTVRTDAGEFRGDLVVAADGIHSPTRRALFPGHPEPVYSGVTAWRGLAPMPDPPPRNSESWGRGQVFGAHPLDERTVYFYATDLAPPGGGSTTGGATREAAAGGDELAELSRRFGGWHEPIPQLLRSADPAAVLRNDLYYLRDPLPAMHAGRVALLGDAAHPMTPHLGQGACQALEDAVVLAHLAGGDLAAYTEARLGRTAKVVRESMSICRMTKLRNPLPVALRDTAMALTTRLIPDLMLRRVDGILGWRPPAPAANDPVPGGRG